MQISPTVLEKVEQRAPAALRASKVHIHVVTEDLAVISSAQTQEDLVALMSNQIPFSDH